MAHRDADLARYMARPEAKRALGLTDCTLVKVAAGGAIRYVKGPEKEFSERLFLFPSRRCDQGPRKRSKAMQLAAKAYSKPGKLIVLRHAMKNYLGRDSGLVDVIAP
jgi:hypothetical protein